MNVVPTTAKHVADAQAWLLARGRQPWPASMFSLDGWAVEGVAAVWLYLTGPFALIEMLSANPAVDDAKRSAALDAVVSAALDDANRRGVRAVFATTTHAGVVARANRLGFKTLREHATMLVADLGGA
jgi:N-acetylglutamate synthase-like GNAT family acetyltransferase